MRTKWGNLKLEYVEESGEGLPTHLDTDTAKVIASRADKFGFPMYVLYEVVYGDYSLLLNVIPHVDISENLRAGVVTRVKKIQRTKTR